MKLKLTVEEVLDAKPGLDEVMEARTPIELTRRLVKMAKEINEVTESLNDFRRKLLKELGDPVYATDDDGKQLEKDGEPVETGTYQVNALNLKEFNDLINAEVEKEVDIDTGGKLLSGKELEQHVPNISGRALMALEPLMRKVESVKDDENAA